MSHLDPERLALIAIGETATDAETEHLATCDECSLELAELERTVAVGRSTVTVGELETPPERVWEGVLEEVRAQARAKAESAESPSAEAVPAESARAESAPAEAADPAVSAGTRRVSRRASRRARTLYVLAASVAAVLVVVGVWNLVRPPASVEIASATLAAFPDHPDAAGQATVAELSDGERTVTVRLDDEEDRDGFREVWLITADASALVSLGELEGAEGTFTVPADVDLRDFVLVDVSQEPDDGDPAHSGDSIVRGELEFS